MWVRASHLYKEFALQLQHLLNAQTWGTQGTSKEHQSVLKILYSLENTAFSTVCSAPPSFNPPTARSAEVKATSARSLPQQGRFHQPDFHRSGEAGGSQPSLVPSSKGLSPQAPSEA